MSRSIHELQKKAAEAFRAAGIESAELDALLLLEFVTGKKRITLIRSPEVLTEKEEARFFELVERRVTREPIAYITGTQEFWGLPFIVTKEVLIPRPETELLVEKAIQYISAQKKIVQILDLGTGSGCIPCAIAHQCREKVQIVAVDKRAESLAIAKQNIEQLGLSKYITCIESNWFTKIEQKFDLILSNPPYVAHNEERSPETNFEPTAALFSEDFGLEDIKKIISQAPQFLNPNGKVFIEIGAGQGSRILDLCPGAKVHSDLAGRERVVEI